MAAFAAMPFCRASARLSNPAERKKANLLTACGRQDCGFKILFNSRFRFRLELSAYIRGLGFDK